MEHGKFSIASAIHQGRSHEFNRINCQDSLLTDTIVLDGNIYYLGALSDGCGSGQYSEVGSRTAVQYALKQMRHHLVNNKLPLSSIPQILYNDMIAVVKRFVQLMPNTNNDEVRKYIEENWLFTLFACIIGSEETIVMASGDGVVVINNDRHLLDKDNTADYLTYHLLGKSLSIDLPSNFTVYSIPTHQLDRLMIGSDAWLQEQELLDEVWEKEHLQLCINKWIRDRHFSDDVSVIRVMRIIPAEGTEHAEN